MIELTPLLNPDREEPMYAQLYTYVREEIRGHRLVPGGRLPSQRNLARHLGVSRNTVDAAYQQLLAEGYVHSEERKGLFIAELPDDLPLRGAPPQLKDSAPGSIPPVDTHPVQALSTEPICDFRYGDIDTEHFPFKTWKTLAARSLSADHAHLLLYGEVQGEKDLRLQIAKYVYQARGVSCRPEQIVIGAGTPFLLDLLRKLIGGGGRYAMEDPGYLRARHVLEEDGRAVASIPLDEHGIRVDRLAAADANVVYVTPSHQFPLGMIMPAARRLDLVQWARERGGTILEDDYDSEFRYEGRPIPSLHSLDPYGNTVYMGTFSKSLMPSARIGYIVLPEKLLCAYREREEQFKQTVPRLEQHTLGLFMAGGEWERHLNRMRQLYKKRYTALREAIGREWGDSIRVVGSAAGLHVVLELGGALAGLSEKNAIDAAKHRGVIVYGGSAFQRVSAEQAPVRILLGFAGLTEAKIEQGIIGLGQAWADFDPPPVSVV
ncbi:PLP-dependent aminotransferase family protein [Saccharibacillus qingshengii]|uniref:MocR-like pyridoxine biosynthesis transcription factor PdxR n=1 Tax=Saccharibacillus qingshengii TaxID=1763540 RepID=UPI001554E47F|nr:PLP-dependent aminotransferase family protein [Saccharibacillus qingshengii]